MTNGQRSGSWVAERRYACSNWTLWLESYYSTKRLPLYWTNLEFITVIIVFHILRLRYFAFFVLRFLIQLNSAGHLIDDWPRLPGQ